MKYYITDANFNVLSVHPDRDSAKAVWDVNWKAGVDVYLESEENHLKNIEWAKDYRERKKKREQYAVSVMLKEEAIEREHIKELNNKIGGNKSAIVEDIAIKESLNEIKVNHELFESAENNVKPMSFEFEEAAQREAKEARINNPTEDCDDCLWIIKETDGDITVCDECNNERNKL